MAGGRTLNNPGTASLGAASGRGDFGVSVGSIINNTGTWNIADDTGIGGAGTFNNYGMLEKSSGGDPAQGGGSGLSMDVNNWGTLQVLSSELEIVGIVTNNGAVDVQAGAILSLEDGLANFSGSTLTGGTYGPSQLFCNMGLTSRKR